MDELMDILWPRWDLGLQNRGVMKQACICLYMGGCIDGYVDTYRHRGVMHVHMCIRMVGLHIRTGWPEQASACSRAYTHT